MANKSGMRIRAYLIEQRYRAREYKEQLELEDEINEDRDSDGDFELNAEEIGKVQREIWLLNDIIDYVEHQLTSLKTVREEQRKSYRYYCPAFGKNRVRCKDVVATLKDTFFDFD